MTKIISVGLWIELTSELLNEGYGEGILRWARQVALGICKLPEVTKLLIPTEAASVPMLTELLTNRDGELPQKIEFIPIVFRSSFDSDALASITKSEQVIRKVGASSNPLTWISVSLERAKEHRTLNRKLHNVAGTLLRLSTASLRIHFAKTKCSIKKIKLDLSQKKLSADLWISPDPLWQGVFAHHGKKILTLPDPNCLEFEPKVIDKAAAVEQTETIRKSVEWSDAVVCFSAHVKLMHLNKVVTNENKPIRVIPHASVTDTSLVADRVLNKQELGNRFRKYFSETRFCRFFCDFPFENCEYLLVSSKCRPAQNYARVLATYEILLRRQRRNLKLVVTGNLSGDATLRQMLTSRGLVYDVIECTNIDEEFHEGLLANASCLIIPPLSASWFPFGFADANRLGVPVAMSRIPVTEEMLGAGLVSPEYFDASSVDDMARGVGYTVDNREAVLRRQRELSRALPERSWVDVARDFVHCLD